MLLQIRVPVQAVLVEPEEAARFFNVQPAGADGGLHIHAQIGEQWPVGVEKEIIELGKRVGEVLLCAGFRGSAARSEASGEPISRKNRTWTPNWSG